MNRRTQTVSHRSCRLAALLPALLLLSVGCSKPPPPEPKPAADEVALLERANRLLSRITTETDERYTPAFLYESPTYRRVTEDICAHKDLFFAAAESGHLDAGEFFVAWQSMEHLPLVPYIEWMRIWVKRFKAGAADYRRLRKILFPNMDENPEYYYHFGEPTLASFYKVLRRDSTFVEQLKQDNSLARYRTSAHSAFESQVDAFLTGAHWETVKQEIAACQIVPSREPKPRDCPASVIREKEKPPKWWKVKCDAAFGDSPSPDTYWSGPGGDAPWWEKP